jgi:hypothetical protein
LTATSGGGVFSGELVVTNTARRQFRLVGHGGTLTAPVGTPLEALNGKPVAVELAGGGRVLRITEEPIYFEPITHGQETVSGQFVVRDPSTGAFAIAGDDRIYTAPPGVDIRPYGGRIVEVRLNDAGHVTRIRAVEATAPVVITCVYDGRSYSDGMPVCQSGTQYRCENGTWRNEGLGCAEQTALPCNAAGVIFGDGVTRCENGTRVLCEHGQWRSLGTICSSGGATLPWPLSCAVGDATVANGSSICRNGTTFRCADGSWVNVGAACS